MRADASDASASPPSESSEVVAVCVCSPVDTFRLGDIEASPLVVNTESTASARSCQRTKFEL